MSEWHPALTYTLPNVNSQDVYVLGGGNTTGV
jgi:hypothetical protein